MISRERVKKAIEKIEEAKLYRSEDAASLLDEAIAIFQQPECEMCGDSKYIGPHPGPYKKGEPDAVPCPKCQTPTTKFIKQTRYKAENIAVIATVQERNSSDQEERKYAKALRLLSGLLLEACTIIETLIEMRDSRDETIAELQQADKDHLSAKHGLEQRFAAQVKQIKHLEEVNEILANRPTKVRCGCGQEIVID